MKNKKTSIMILTLVIVGIGAGILFFSTNWVMADVQKRLGSSGDVVKMNEMEIGDAEISNTEEVAGPVQEDDYEGLQSIASAEFLYYGQKVYVVDDMVEKEVAMENGKKIMDFVFDYIDETILTPYNIDKTSYTYAIERQNEENSTQYGVFLLNKGRIQCTMGVCLNEDPKLESFARDGLVDLYGNFEKPIPKEYLIENWCDNRQKKEDIYDAYYASSKEIIENVLGLAPIDDTFRDVTKESCFSAGNDWSNVTFGYRLKDGTQIRIFYNRINQMWNGFYIQ